MTESAGAAPRHLSLYHFDYCPYCVDVRRALSKLPLSVELRNVHKEPKYMQELVAARGRRTVPVLRIEEASGEVRWMPESLDIIAYLRSLASVGGAPPRGGLGPFDGPLAIRAFRLVPLLAAVGSAVAPWPWLRWLLVGVMLAALLRRYRAPGAKAA